MVIEDLIYDVLKVEPRLENLSYKVLLEHLPRSLEDMRSRDRKADLVMSRQLAIFVHYLDSGMISLERTGKALNRDHSTVIHSIKMVARGFQGFEKVREKFFNKVLKSIDDEENKTTNINHLIRLEERFISSKLRNVEITKAIKNNTENIDTYSRDNIKVLATIGESGDSYFEAYLVGFNPITKKPIICNENGVLHSYSTLYNTKGSRLKVKEYSKIIKLIQLEQSRFLEDKLVYL